MRNYLTNRDYWAGDLFQDLFDDSMFKVNNKHLMKTDIKEDEKKYDIEIEMPGFKKEDIKISLNNSYLTVEANVDSKEEKEEKKHYIYHERYDGAMSRSYYVGNTLREEDINARFENGILHIEIPKKQKEVEEKKYIQIA